MLFSHAFDGGIFRVGGEGLRLKPKVKTFRFYRVASRSEQALAFSDSNKASGFRVYGWGVRYGWIGGRKDGYKGGGWV